MEGNTVKAIIYNDLMIAIKNSVHLYKVTEKMLTLISFYASIQL